MLRSAPSRRFGQRYDSLIYGRALRRFDRFLQCHVELAGAPLHKLAEAWSDSNPGPQHLCEAYEVARLLSKAMHRLDANAAILPVGVGVRRRARQQQRQPYIYTKEEIERILLTARTFPSPKAPLRPLGLYTMIVLAYCAG